MKVKSEREVAQSCPTLSDPMDCSLPGSSVHGIFQASVLELGAIAFSPTMARTVLNTVSGNSSVLGQSCPALCYPMDYSLPGSSIHEILQAEHWSELPFPSPGDLPDPGIKPKSPEL